MKRRSRRQWAICLLLCVTGCIDTSPTAERQQLVVMAPVEVRGWIGRALATYYSNLGTAVPQVQLGYSAQISREAIYGDAHLLITTHSSWADYVASRTEVLARADVGTDELVVATLIQTSPVDIAQLAAAELGGIAIPSTESDPVGMYAREALLRYGIWSQVQPRLTLLPGSDESLRALREGTVGAAILFAGTASDAQLPLVASIDPAYHQPIRFEALLLHEDHPQARELFDYLTLTLPNPAARWP